jgi:hypothetical protein
MTKKTGLMLSDDCRMNSGISTECREILLGTLHKYRWVNIGGAIKHPEAGKVVDMSAAAAQATGVKDAYLKIYPIDGYGNEDILFAIMAVEKPDFIVHFTDPRFWGWLYQLERQIRSKIPLTYYTIWDDVPLPQYNRAFYESCDNLMAISKQTLNITKWVLRPDNCCAVDGWYDTTTGELVPWQINEFKPDINAVAQLKSELLNA